MNRHMSANPNTPTTSSITPRTVQEDTPVSTDSIPETNTETTTPTAVPAAPQAVRWVYWLAYSLTNGTGAVECSFPAPITHGVQLAETAKQLAQKASVPSLVVTGFTLLRVEDAAGQVIG